MGASYNFDGNDVLNYGTLNNLTGATSLTICYWALWTAKNPGDGQYGQYTNYSAPHIYAYSNSTTNYQLSVRTQNLSGFNTGWANFGSEIALNTWYFMTTQWDGINDKGRLYVDGVLKTEVSAPSSMNYIDSSSYNLVLGGITSSLPHAGNLAYFRMFDRPLSVPEIKEIKYSPNSISGGLVLSANLIENDPKEYVSGVSPTPVGDPTPSKNGPPVVFAPLEQGN